MAHGLRGGLDRRRGIEGPLQPRHCIVTQPRRFGRVVIGPRGDDGRLSVVEGDDLRHRLLPPLGAAGEPVRGRGVEPCPLRPGEGPVGDLADQDVAKRVAIGLRRSDKVAHRKPLDKLIGIVEPHLQGRDPRQPEGPAVDRAKLERPPLAGRQKVKARQDGGLDGVGQLLDRPLLNRRPYQLPGVEGIALRALDHLGDKLRRFRFQQVADELGHGAVGKRLETHREVVAAPSAPGRTPVEKLGPGKCDQEDRRLAAWLHQVLDQVEEAVGRPMQILEDDHQRRGSGGRFDRLSPGGEELSAIGSFGLGHADRGRQELGAGRIGGDRLQPGPDCVQQLRRLRVLAHTGEREENLPHRPVGHLLAVGKALGGDNHGIRPEAVEPPEELLEQPRLSGPGGRDQADQRWPPLGEGTLGDELKLLEIGVSTHQRRPRRQSGRLLPAADHFLRRYRRRLALRFDRQLTAELEAGRRCVGGPFRHQHLPGLGRLLEPGGDVHDVPGDKEIAGRGVPRGDDLARRQPEAHRQAIPQALVRPDPVAERQGGSHRPLGVVSVRRREAEHGHHRISDELLQGAPMLGDHALGVLVVAAEEGANLLGVHLLAHRGRSGHVGEEDRHNPPLLTHGQFKSGPISAGRLVKTESG
jgi:hypothetical protein